MSNSFLASKRLLAALSFMAWSGPILAGQWYVDYGNGLKALKAGEYGKAAALLEKAVVSRPEPSKRARTYGQRYVEYYPYFHLGKAYLALGEEAKAREMLETSERLGELRGAPRLARQRQRGLITLNRPNPAIARLSDQEKKRIEKGLSAAEALSTQANPGEARVRLGELRHSLPEGAEAGGYLRRIDDAIRAAGAQQARAKEELEAGMDSLERGAYDAARQRFNKALELDSSQTVARDALAQLQQKQSSAVRRRDLTKLLSEARAAMRRGDFELVGKKIAEARALNAENPELRSLITELKVKEIRRELGPLMKQGEALFDQKLYEEARQKFAEVLERRPAYKPARDWLSRTEARLASALSEADKLNRLEARLEAARAAVKQQQIRSAMQELQAARVLDPANQAVDALSAKLIAMAQDKARRAFALQVRGLYGDAIPQFDDALAALSDRAAPHLYLALACYGRYLFSGEKDSGLAERARVEVREALRLDPEIQPDPRVTSPRLLAVLEEVGREQP